MLAVAVWLPPILCGLLWAVFSIGIPRDLPVAVVDHDRSTQSRRLVRYLDASPVMQVDHIARSVREGKGLLTSGETYALIVIPHKFQHDTMRGGSPATTAIFNAQYLLVAKQIRSALYEIEANVEAEIRTAHSLPDMPVLRAAMAIAVPVRPQITPLYNSNLNYAQFLLPGLIAALLQVVICSSAVIAIGRCFKYSDQAHWKVESNSSVILGKLLPYLLIHSFFCFLSLYLFYGWLEWPLQGNLLLLIPLVFLFVASCLALGVFFFAVAGQLERALSLAGAFCAPAFAFLGVTFPVSDMSPFARFWRELMPASHWLDGLIHETAWAAGTAGLWAPSISLAAYLLIFPAAITLLSRLLHNIQEDEHSEYI